MTMTPAARPCGADHPHRGELEQIDVRSDAEYIGSAFSSEGPLSVSCSATCEAHHVDLLQ